MEYKIKKIKKFPVLLIVIGILELFKSLNIFNFGFLDYWPVLLIVIGCIMIWNSFLE
ncbi:MAG: hypothetical protein HRU03_03815 [Nanoarchaeales archaeon]|nr:hypothetical protein [Nanoarchaeales archaeon]